MAEKNYCFLIPLTDEQKKLYDKKRKQEGKTSQGLMHQLVLEYLSKGATCGNTDNG